MVHKVSAKNFVGAVVSHSSSTKPVVVDVWADWCGPCKMLAPNFQAAAKELEGKARFVKLDADKNQKLVRKYKVMSLPTILFFKDGEVVDRKSGVMTKNAIIKRVKPYLSEEDKTEISGDGFKWKFWKK